MEATETAGGDEKRLLERMQQLSANLLERNGDLEGSIRNLMNDVETATTRMSGCRSQAQLQRDASANVAQTLDLEHDRSSQAEPSTSKPAQDAKGSWRRALQSGFSAAAAWDQQAEKLPHLPFIFGSASYLEDAAGGLEHPDWSAISPHQPQSEAASLASPASEQEELIDPPEQPDPEAEAVGEDSGGMADFRSMLDAALQAKPG